MPLGTGARSDGQGPNPPIAVGECWAYLTNLQYAGPEERIIALGANWSGVVSMSAPRRRERASSQLC